MSSVIKWEPWGKIWLDRYYAGTHNDLQEHEKVDEWTAIRGFHSKKRPRPPTIPPKADEKSEEEPPTIGGRRRKNKSVKPKAKFASYFKPEPECRLDEYYALMGLRKRGKHANEEDLKKAYKKVSILYHPDRIQNKGGDIARAEERYKAVQKAYDTLKDPWSRKLWESGRSFDDEIPSDTDGTGTPEEFFDTYTAAFNRWAYWSSDPDPPDLGNLETPDDDVEEFFEFWYTFKSWRDFNFHGEHTLEDAETRDEKRWMAQQNAKDPKVKAAKKDEKQKIRRMVDNAYKNDPRVNRIAERRRQEKEAKKQAKKEAKRRRKEEAERADREVRAREEAERVALEEVEARRLKDVKNKQRKLRKLRTQVRKLCAADDYENIDPNDIDLLCAHGTHEYLKPLVHALKAKSTDALSLLETSVASAKQVLADKEATKAAEIKRLEAEEQARKAEKQARLDWSKQEMELLSKAVSRYPGGTLERWDKIRKFLDKESGGGCVRTNDEIIGKVKSLSKKVKSRAKKDKHKSKRARAPPEEDPNAWSEIQQKELEKALKMCRQIQDVAERWNRIADLVPGKDKAECIDRFKEIRAQLMKSRGK